MKTKINMYKHKGRLFLIDRTMDAITYAQIKSILELNGLGEHLFTINSCENPDGFYINPFYSKCDCKSIAATIIPKQRNGDKEQLSIAIKARELICLLCDYIGSSTGDINIDLLISFLKNNTIIKEPKTKAQITIVKAIENNKPEVQYAINTLFSLKAEPLLNKHCEFEDAKGFLSKKRKEINTKKVYLTASIVYLYSASSHKKGSIVDNLIRNSFAATCDNVPCISESMETKVNFVYDLINKHQSPVVASNKKAIQIAIKNTTY